MEEMGSGLAEKMAVSEWFGYMSFVFADTEGVKTVLSYLVVDSGFDGTIMIE